MLRYGSLSAMSNKVCFYASKSADGYAMLMNEFSRWEGICEGLRQKEEETSLKFGSAEQCPPNIVKDPNIVKIKCTQARQGVTRKRRQCHLCRGYGHTKRSDSFSTADPTGSTPNSDDGFSFDNDLVMDKMLSYD
ncbi:unnamed protein product [Prunus armeniaca]